jgi:hypothetical protein
VCPCASQFERSREPDSGTRSGDQHVCHDALQAAEHNTGRRENSRVGRTWSWRTILRRPSDGRKGRTKEWIRKGALRRWTATPVDLVFGSNSELRAVAEVYSSDYCGRRNRPPYTAFPRMWP